MSASNAQQQVLLLLLLQAAVLAGCQSTVTASAPFLAAKAPAAPPLEVAASEQSFPSDVVWTDARALGINGRAFPESVLNSPYDRFPASVQKTVDSNTWALSATAVGMSTAFRTNATDVYVRYNFSQSGAEGGDWLWPINGHSGADVYVASGASNGTFRWAASSGNGCENMHQAFAEHATSYAVCLAGAENPTNENRTFLVYLPARGLLESVEIGVSSSAAPPVGVAPYDPTKKPVLWYGTSIMHGAATLHAGMQWTNQADRMLQRVGWNYGFSGDGIMQPEVGAVLASLDPAVYVLDCEFNMDRFSSEEVKNRTLAFVRQLHAARPTTPVVISEGHPAGDRWVAAGVFQRQNATRAGYRLAFNELLASGEAENLFFLEGDGKFGGDFNTDFEAQVSTVHAVHPSMYGMMHMAKWGSDFVSMVLNGTAPAQAPLPIPPFSDQTMNSAVRQTARIHSVASSSWITSDKTNAETSITWTDARDLGVEGKGWNASETPSSFWQRFPDRAQSTVPSQIWELSLCTTGILVRFSSDAAIIYVNVTRNTSTAAGGWGVQDDIMSFNGRFGLDVYMRDSNNDNAWRWAATSGGGATAENEVLQLTLANSPVSGTVNDFTVYLPTHVSLQSVFVGVPDDAKISPLRPYDPDTMAKPIVIWGSSIAQGGVVQNAGMPWPTALQRILDAPLLNFGFSGMCRMQPEVATVLGELSPRAFLLDCLPNMDAISVNTSAVPVLHQLRNAFGPDVPIVVLEGHTYTNAWIVSEIQEEQQAKRSAMRAAFQQAIDEGVPNLHYISGDGKLASLGEAQFDACGGAGVHPSNIAHLRIAEYVASSLKPLLPPGV